MTRGTKITRAVLRRERTRQRRATHSHSLSYVRSKQRLRSYNGGKIGSARAQHLRQLGDVGGDAPGLVAGQQTGSRSPPLLLLEIDVGERLPVGVADDEAGLLLVDRPGRGGALQQNAPPATPETARGLLRALVVLAQQLSSSTSRAFVASPAHHFW